MTVYTYEADRPESAAVYNKPSLLAEPSHLLLFAEPHILGKRSQEVLHGCSAQPRQENDDEQNEVDIVEAGAIRFGLRVEVLQGKELGGISLGFGQQVVGAEQESQEVEGEAWVRMRVSELFHHFIHSCSAVLGSNTLRWVDAKL